MAQTTGIDFHQLARDYDHRPFASADKPTLVLLPFPEGGGFDVTHCYPEQEKAKALARRIRRLPLLEGFYLRHADPDIITERTFMGKPLDWVISAIEEKEKREAAELMERRSR